MIQGGLITEEVELENGGNEVKSYHINQRNEGIDLGGLSGALMATQTIQMQTFITKPTIVLNDQGGERMDVTENIVSTLRAGMGGNVPIVLGSQQGGAEVCYNLCPTITSAAGTSGNNQPVMLFDNHATGARYDGPLKVAPTITARFGTGGNNIPLVSNYIEGDMGESYCIASNIINRQDHNGGNGTGVQEDISYTLTGSDIHAVYHPKSYQKIVGTLCQRDYKGADIRYISQDKCIIQPYQDVVGALCRDDYKGINSQYVSQDKCIVEEQKTTESSNVIQDAKDSEIRTRNLVRRLTPLECERLQGFPDGWTKIEKATDSPRYKALGNSVAIPCVTFLLQGVAFFVQKQYEMEKEE